MTKSLIVALAAFLVFTVLYGRFIIQNDGISYYAMALSLVEDGDFDLNNQYAEHPEIRMIPIRHSSKAASYYSCGFGILYAPFVLVMDQLEAVAPSLGAWRPYAQNARFPAVHGIAILMGSILYGAGCVLLGYFVLVRKYNASPWAACAASLLVFVGTPLICYAFTIPSFSHASDTFLVTLAFWLAVVPKPWRFGARNACLGFTLALSILLRNNNIVLVPVFVLALLFFERGGGWKHAMATCLQILLGALPVLAVHVHFNLTQYGKIIATGYEVVGVSQEAVSQGTINSHDILFHPVVGVYVWSPVSFLASLGLLYGTWKRRRETVLALVVAIIVIVSICFTAVIWPGSSFGQRLLTHIYICWVVGLYELFTLARKPVAAAAVVAALWSFFLFNMYFIIAASPTARRALFQNQDEYTPANVMRIAAAEYRVAAQEGKVSNPIEYWYRALCTRPYPTLQHILFRGY